MPKKSKNPDPFWTELNTPMPVYFNQSYGIDGNGQIVALGGAASFGAGMSPPFMTQGEKNDPDEEFEIAEITFPKWKFNMHSAPKPKCTCGAEKTYGKQTWHSSWCDLAENKK